ncbi:MAG: hypothetical protein GXP47_14780 [Acidobacteria bacterium]|nr:hypothetical protein [Acidobacteriota bacterium]
MKVSAVDDFEDLLRLFDRHRVRALIIGGMAFIYHAKPRYTKDMDLWLDPEETNVERANRALQEFGSPELLDPYNAVEILQVGVEPNRIDLLRHVAGMDFQVAWERRIRGSYGEAPANWIDLDSLIAIKSAIDHPRHQEDARILRQVKAMREGE